MSSLELRSRSLVGSVLGFALLIGCGAGPEMEERSVDPVTENGAWNTGVAPATAIRDLSAAQVATLCQAMKAEADKAQLAMSGRKIVCYTLGLLFGITKEGCESQVASCLAMDWKEMPRCTFSVPGAGACTATVAEVKACSDADIANIKMTVESLSCASKLPMLGQPESCKMLYAKCPALDPNQKPM